MLHHGLEAGSHSREVEVQGLRQALVGRVAVRQLLAQRFKLPVLHQVVELAVDNVLRALLAQPLEQLLLLLLAELASLSLLALPLILLKSEEMCMASLRLLLLLLLFGFDDVSLSLPLLLLKLLFELALGDGWSLGLFLLVGCFHDYI